MESFSPEIKPNPEIKPALKLTSENVQSVYQAAVMKSGEYGGKQSPVHDLLNHTSFDQDRLESKREAIEQFADQLLPRFFRPETGGADYKDAQEDQYYNQWAKSSQDVHNLLALISAIGLGRVTTSREVVVHSPPKDRDKIFYLVDKKSYQKDRQRQTQVYGGFK